VQGARESQRHSHARAPQEARRLRALSDEHRGWLLTLSGVSRASALLQVQKGCGASSVERARGQTKVGIAAEPSAPHQISRTGTPHQVPAGVAFQPAGVGTRHRAALLTELELLQQQLRFLRGVPARRATSKRSRCRAKQRCCPPRRRSRRSCRRSPRRCHLSRARA